MRERRRADRKPRQTDRETFAREVHELRELLETERALVRTKDAYIAARDARLAQMERELLEADAWVEHLRRYPLVVPRERQRMPDTRRSIKWCLRVGQYPHGIGCKVDVGLFDDNRVGEVFIRLDREHRHAVGGQWADMSCTYMSICLQYGAPLRELLAKMIGAVDDSGGLTFFRPNPDVREYVRDPVVPMVLSLRDYLGKRLRAFTDEDGRWIGKEWNEAREVAA